MSNEEKHLLLLKVLCKSLPYGVICKLSAKDGDADVSITEKLDIGGLEHFIVGTMDIKPYLRPMSSMTEEEKKEFDKVLKSCNDKVFACPEKERRYKFFDAEQEDFMNAHHFDYRGLIPMGLALEALEGMYKEENK